MRKSLIALSLCRWQLKDRDEGWYHLVGEKYVRIVLSEVVSRIAPDRPSIDWEVA